MNIKNIIDTIFNSEETTPRSMLQSFHKLVEVLSEYIEEHAIEGPEGPEGQIGPEGPQGPEGLSIFTTQQTLSTSTDNIELTTIDNLETERTIKVGDLILSTGILSLGFISRVVNVTQTHAETVHFTNIRGPQGLEGPVGPFGVRLPLVNGKINVADLETFIEQHGNTFFVDTSYANDDGGILDVYFGPDWVVGVDTASFVKIYIAPTYIVITNNGTATYYSISSEEDIEFRSIEDVVVVTSVNTY